MEAKSVNSGDDCPQCGGTFVPARVPTDAEYARAFDRENPGTLPPGSDSATPAQRQELGALHRCQSCGYLTRFPADEPEPVATGSTPSKGKK